MRCTDIKNGDRFESRNQMGKGDWSKLHKEKNHSW